ncbi:hypothetical protein LTR94_033528, partial [Friedmanniomyces endolithicus]
PGLWAHRTGAIGPALRVAPARQGRSCHRGHENPLGTVPALRLPPYPDLPAPPGAGIELVAHPPHLAPGRPAAAQEAPPQAHCQQSAEGLHALQGQRCVGLRLRLRHHGSRPADQVPHGDRRVHARVPGDRRGRLHPFASGGG